MRWNTFKRRADSELRRVDAGWSELQTRLGKHFPRHETRSNASAYIKGLLGRVERKNGWQLAEAAGHNRPDKLQYLLERARWDADVARDDLIAYVRDTMGTKNGALVLDETGFLKKGQHSVGVQRQYSGTAGRIENCQVGVFIAYASHRGRTLIDRELYVPRSWHDDEARCKQAGVPKERAFATKPQLAIAMLERAIAGGIQAAWVLGDEVYGNDTQLRRWCEGHRQPYVLAVSCQHRVWIDWRQVRVDEVLKRQPDGVWHTLSAGQGTKGERKYAWALWSGPCAHAPKGWTKGILFRRSLCTNETSYYSVFMKPGTTLPHLASAAGRRWAVEECFQSAKGEVGLDEYEVRTWKAWHRHMTLAMWAHAFLTVQRMHLEQADKKKHADRHERRTCAHLDSRNSARTTAPAVASATQS
jgi:SRSO17 transposase